MQIPSIERPDHPRVDAILVLGRGIEPDGTLSEMSRLRAEAGAQAARILTPRIVVFSGGRSWRQAAQGVQPPSEGGGMLDHALAHLGNTRPEGVTFAAEEDSESTTENMVKSAPILKLLPGESLRLVSDNLHFSHNRPQELARRIFAMTDDIDIISIPTPHTSAEAREERMTTLATNAALFGVRRGDVHAIMRRQRLLEKANSWLRR